MIFLLFPTIPKKVISQFIKILLIIYQCIVTEIDRSITKKYVIQPESVNYHKKETRSTSTINANIHLLHRCFMWKIQEKNRLPSSYDILNWVYDDLVNNLLNNSLLWPKKLYPSQYEIVCRYWSNWVKLEWQLSQGWADSSWETAVVDDGSPGLSPHRSLLPRRLVRL